MDSAEKRREWQRRFRERNPDYFRDWKRENYKKNREKILAQQKEYRLRKIGVLAPKERARAVVRRDYTKEWRQRNIEHVRRKRREYVAKRPEYFRKLLRGYQLKAYGLTHEIYDRMARRQQNRCSICRREGTEQKRLVVDHDHQTNKVRALLCHQCNRALGLLGDDAARVTVAGRYLRKWQRRHAEPATSQ